MDEEGGLRECAEEVHEERVVTKEGADCVFLSIPPLQPLPSALSHTLTLPLPPLSPSSSLPQVKFNVNKVDNMIIQAIALLDTLDKDVNTFVMRVREWYSWHFPELVKVVNDNYQ